MRCFFSPFPAYAGINLISTEKTLDDLTIPRVCGDKPLDKTFGIPATNHSPRMRG